MLLLPLIQAQDIKKEDVGMGWGEWLIRLITLPVFPPRWPWGLEETEVRTGSFFVKHIFF